MQKLSFLHRKCFNVFFLLCFCISLPAKAQQINNTPGIKRADLAIAEVKLIEATRNTATGLHTIKVSVTIKNNGNALAVSTSLKMMIQNNLINMVAPQYPQPKNAWYQLGETNSVNAIAVAQSFTAQYFFTETKKVTQQGIGFTMQLVADAGNTLIEINETDNLSDQIKVTPVASIQEYVPVTPTVQVTAELKKVDTLMYTIGKADFHVQGDDRTVPADVFLQTDPQGITIKRMGVDMTTPIRNMSLVAPLHLPVGAVIRKVEFNYIILPGNNTVPHLVLRSNYFENNGGWGANKAITSYWTGSSSLNTNSGYDVKSSVTTSGFNVPIAKKSSHYFEVLASNASSTATPTESNWPPNNQFYIWGINVYYTLN